MTPEITMLICKGIVLIVPLDPARRIDIQIGNKQEFLMVLQMIQQGDELVYGGGQFHLDRHLQIRSRLPGREDLGAGHLDPLLLGQIFQDLLQVGGSHRRVGPGKELAFRPGQGGLHGLVGLDHPVLALQEALIFAQYPAPVDQFLAP